MFSPPFLCIFRRKPGSILLSPSRSLIQVSLWNVGPVGLRS